LSCPSSGSFAHIAFANLLSLGIFTFAFVNRYSPLFSSGAFMQNVFDNHYLPCLLLRYIHVRFCKSLLALPLLSITHALFLPSSPYLFRRPITHSSFLSSFLTLPLQKGDIPDHFGRDEVLEILREYYEGLSDGK
jgi:hypothetical protein